MADKHKNKEASDQGVEAPLPVLPATYYEISKPTPERKGRELREWLGLTFADLLVYLAIAALATMFFVKDEAADAALAIAAAALSLASCPFGMKRDPEFSALTNTIKRISYPLFVVLVVGGIVAHYAVFR